MIDQLTLNILCLAASYLIGALPFGLWIGLLWRGVDIRTLGSKNIGATNVLRVLGPGPGLTVFVLDTVKGTAGILLLKWAYHHLLAGTPSPAFWLQVVVGLLAILGHSFSIFLKMKGGKGVATSGGVLLGLAPIVAGVGLLAFIIVLALSRYVSLGSLAAAFSLPITSFVALHGEQQVWMTALGLTLAILVTIKHRANLERLRNGTESKIGQRVTSQPTVEVPETQQS